MSASKSSTFGASAVPAEPVPAGELEDDLAELLLMGVTEGDTPCSGDVGDASSSVKAEEPSPAKKARTAKAEGALDALVKAPSACGSQI